MWNCIKQCVQEALPKMGWIALAGLIGGIFALISGSIVSGGAAAPVLTLSLIAILKVAGFVLAGDVIGTLLGCILGCAFR